MSSFPEAPLWQDNHVERADSYISANERIITIEDSAELHVAAAARRPAGDAATQYRGKGEVRQRTGSKQSAYAPGSYRHWRGA